MIAIKSLGLTPRVFSAAMRSSRVARHPPQRPASRPRHIHLSSGTTTVCAPRNAPVGHDRAHARALNIGRRDATISVRRRACRWRRQLRVFRGIHKRIGL